MKKLLVISGILLLIYLSISLIIKLNQDGHNISYNIKNNDLNFSIKENYYKKEKMYRINIKTNKNNFDVKVFYNNKKKKKVLTEIKYFKDDTYECILPVFKDKKILTDLICLNNNEFLNYYNLKGKSSELDNFINKLIKDGYVYQQWFTDNGTKLNNGITAYYKNIVDKHNIIIRNYKGISIINSKTFDKIELFNSDIYDNKVNIMVNQYYLTADYNEKYDFNKIYVVNILNGNVGTIKSNNKISLDSYFQGVVDNKAYLFDRSNKKQYRLNPKNYSIEEIGNVNTKINYYDNKWSKISAYEAVKKDYIFNTNNIIPDNIKNNKYYRIDLTDNSKKGFYYFYEKRNNLNYVYRSDINTPDNKILLFNISTIEDIKYYGNSLYFISDNIIYNYDNSKGLNKVIQNNEISYNKNNIYNVYIDD